LEICPTADQINRSSALLEIRPRADKINRSPLHCKKYVPEHIRRIDRQYTVRNMSKSRSDKYVDRHYTVRKMSQSI
jgi:hypothetical protein